MLKPITMKMTDESEGDVYCFTFYCDICGSPNQSVTYESDMEARYPNTRESEHIAAFERANLEALNWFSRCPICRRVVCDKCFCILDESDMCKECAELRNKQ
jgi:hypothetical protein